MNYKFSELLSSYILDISGPGAFDTDGDVKFSATGQAVILQFKEVVREYDFMQLRLQNTSTVATASVDVRLNQNAGNGTGQAASCIGILVAPGQTLDVYVPGLRDLESFELTTNLTNVVVKSLQIANITTSQTRDIPATYTYSAAGWTYEATESKFTRTFFGITAGALGVNIVPVENYHVEYTLETVGRPLTCTFLSPTQNLWTVASAWFRTHFTETSLAASVTFAAVDYNNTAVTVRVINEQAVISIFGTPAPAEVPQTLSAYSRFLALNNQWTGVQTFGVPPIFSSLTGYLKGNGAAAISAVTTIPFGDLTGVEAAGAAAAAIAAHLAAVDPHTQYLTQTEADALYASAAAITAAINAHLADGDPHPQYLTTAEGNAAYASLSGAYVNPAWIASLALAKITGAGTMAAQDATAVNITGGAYNGTVGATAPSTGVFTTLQANNSGVIGAVTANGAAFRIVSNQGAAPNSNENTSGLSLVSTTAAGVGVGPNIRFSGESGNGVTPYTFAAIQGSKDSATAGNYQGALTFKLSDSGGALVDPLKLAVGLISLNYSAVVTGSLNVNDNAATAGSNNAVVRNTQSAASQFTCLALVTDSSRQLQIGYTSTGYTANTWLGANAGFLYNNQVGGLALITTGGNLKLSFNLTNLHHEINSTFWRIYNTPDLVNYERSFVRWNGNQFQIGTEIGGTGTARDINIVATGSSSVYLSTNNLGRWQVNPTGHLLAFGANLDIGASGATSPRTVYHTQSAVFEPIASASVTTPATGATIFGRNFAGRTTVTFRRQDGGDVPLVSPMFGVTPPMVVGVASGTTAPTCTGGTLTTAATMSLRYTAGSTNRWTNKQRKRYTSAAAAASGTGVRPAYTFFHRGSVAGYGGFFFAARVGHSTNTTGYRLFAGICASTAALAGDPSALLNCIGIGYDAADLSTGNWILFLNDGAGVATRVDLGATNAARAADQGFDLFIYNPPNSGTFFVQIINVNTGVEVLNTSYDADVPAADTGLTWKVECHTGAVVAAATVEHGFVYLESFQ